MSAGGCWRSFSKRVASSTWPADAMPDVYGQLRRVFDPTDIAYHPSIRCWQ